VTEFISNQVRKHSKRDRMMRQTLKDKKEGHSMQKKEYGKVDLKKQKK
jgi:hypothetical protein